MPSRLAKVPIYGNVAKAVTVNLGATEGAQIGTNLLMPDGSLATTAKLQKLIGTGTQSSSALTTTDDLEEGQWNLYFTPRRAQDAVGAILQDSANVTLRYVGGTSITADLTDAGNTATGTLQALTVDAKGRITGTRAATITGADGRITVAHGDASDGLPTIDLAEVADAGAGTLQRTVFDVYGRKTGTSAATTSDLAEGDHLYFTDARARAAAVADAIDPSVTDVAPSQHAVAEALADAASGVPYVVTDGSSYHVPAGIQALWAIPIDLEGDAYLDIEGALVEVN